MAVGIPNMKGEPPSPDEMKLAVDIMRVKSAELDSSNTALKEALQKSANLLESMAELGERVMSHFGSIPPTPSQ